MCALTVEAIRESATSSQKATNVPVKDILSALKDIVPRNVYLLIQEALQKSMDATNNGIAVHYDQEAMYEKSYDAGLDQWAADAAQLPTAGKQEDTPQTSATNGKGTAYGIGFALAIPVLLALAYTLGAYAVGLELGSIGAAASGAGAPAAPALSAGAALCFAIVAILFLVVAIVVSALGFSGQLPGSKDTIPGHSNYDAGLQQQAVSTVQRDQQLVTQLQNMMSKLMQQFINPANSTKETIANIASSVIQWIKSQIWTER